ncbi:hypothetical protein [uncultured Actinomyces sp.]|uniref:hypothetical protein n=1 Tax=uncultured Actinomyces sp. TaxID=249061 RepID=UPI0026052029|nr:hypothetical protein [uncultured Actinomyces sp.]
MRREDARSTPFLKSVFDDFAKRLESKRIVRISEERWPIGISLWLIIELLIGGIGIEGIARADDISQVMYVSGGASITILLVLVLLPIYCRQVTISKCRSAAYRELGQLFCDRAVSPDLQVLSLMGDSVHSLETDLSRTFKNPTWRAPGFLLVLAGAVFTALFTAVFELGSNGRILSDDPLLNLYQLAGAITVIYLCFYYAPKTVLGRPDLKVALFESALRDLQIEQELKPAA